MTREKQIILSIPEHYSDNDAVYYIRGAKWADENPDGKMLLHVLNKSAELAKKQIIEKVCEYIASNMHCDGYTTQTKAKFIQSLREAMEE